MQCHIFQYFNCVKNIFCYEQFLEHTTINDLYDYLTLKYTVEKLNCLAYAYVI